MTRIVIPLKPVPWMNFRSGKGGSQTYWIVPLECQSRHRVTGIEEDRGKPCDQYLAGEIYCGHTNKDGKWIRHTLSEQGRKNRAKIERYNKYRMDLFHLAKKAGIQVPNSGMAVYYHFPVPVRWPKKKRLEMHGQIKLSRPDKTNLDKGFEDALTDKDEHIGQGSGNGSFWFLPELVDEPLREGYIEILLGQPVYNPYNVTMMEQLKPVALEDLEERRKKRQERRDEIKAEKKEQKRNPKPVKLISEKKLFKKKSDILK